MTITPITIEATLQPDGMNLLLDQKLALTPGRVSLSIKPITSLSGATMLDVLDRIHVERQQRNRRSMTEEEMIAQISELRTEEDPCLGFVEGHLH